MLNDWIEGLMTYYRDSDERKNITRGEVGGGTTPDGFTLT